MSLPDIAAQIKAGGAHPFFYIPAAVVLGALHALEPGHSKSVMVAFIVAVRGTIGQAILLGLSAAFGHTLVIWVLAALGLKFANANILSQAEPWLIFLSGLLIIGLALKLLISVRRQNAHKHHDHDHDDHDHHNHDHSHDHHGHSHMSESEIKTKFGARAVSSAEVIWFGFTGGLIPCPAAFAVLLVCLQLKQTGLGFVMVGAFSTGLAITLVSIGVIAAWGTKQAAGRFKSYEAWGERLPLISGSIVLLLGLGITVRGLIATGIL